MKKIPNRFLSNPIFSSIVFSLLPSLSIYQHNINETFITPLFRAITVSVIFGLLSWLVFFFLFNKNTKKAGILTSVWLLEFFSYGHIYLFLTDLKINNLFPVGFHTVLLAAYLLSFLAVFFMLVKTRSQDVAMRVLNFVSLTALILSLINILPKETSKIIGQYKLSKYLQTHQESLKFSNTDTASFPNIYYFVFDRYANQNILKEYLNFDNSSFVAQLESDDFYVAKNSVANYPATFLSLSSSLNLTHLDFLPEVLGKNYSDQAVVYSKLISNNRITDFLKSLGYTYTHFGSPWKPTSVSNSAEVNINKFQNFNELEMYLYENTVLNTVIGKIFGTQIFSGVETLNLRVQNLPFQLQEFNNLPEKDNPAFVFGHFLLPHKPYLFDSNCQPIDFEIVRQTVAEKGYLDQLQCANKVIKEIIDQIKSTTTRPSVIIIQSDEGPFVPTKYFNEDKYPLENPSDAYKVHGHILNALFLPDKTDPTKPADYKQLGFTEISSPVNTFRTILNYYFGTQLSKLPDKSYVFLDNQKPYDFTEITQELLPEN